MTYRHDKAPRRSKSKLLMWVFLALLAVLYSLMVACWWVEGNDYQKRQQILDERDRLNEGV